MRSYLERILRGRVALTEIVVMDAPLAPSPSFSDEQIAKTLEVNDRLLLKHIGAWLPVHLPETLSIETFDGNGLPKEWRTHAGREVLQSLGGEWRRQLRSCVLAVPSSVMPAELNFLVNPLHPDFKHISLGDPEVLETDMRLS